MSNEIIGLCMLAVAYIVVSVLYFREKARAEFWQDAYHALKEGYLITLPSEEGKHE